MRMSVGVDLHKGQFTVFWRSDDGMVREWQRYRTVASGYEAFEQQLGNCLGRGYELHVAVESTSNARYFKARVERLGIAVTVVNTLQFKVVTKSVKKTDRKDAATLAEFLEKDMLPEARLCSPESEKLRRLLKTRTSLVRTAVTVKNQLHGVLLSMGIEVAKGKLQSKKGRRAARNVLAEQGLPGAAVDPLLETIDRLEEQVKQLEAAIRTAVEGDRAVELIRTIPGAGLITAATIRAFSDDIGRFESYKQFAAYAGVVPWVQESNEQWRVGNITRRGPEELRTALVQIVVGMVRNPKHTARYRLMQRYQAMKRQKGSGKSIIATARKVAKLIWYMLTYDEPFDPARMSDPQLRRAADEMSQAAFEAA